MTTQLVKNPPKILKGFALGGALRDYAVLKTKVQEVLIVGRGRIEKEFMFMRYHTGLLINEHVRLNQDHAAYGSQAVLKLGEDFDIDYTELTRYSQFAKAYPIVGRGQLLELNLPWKCYRKLMIIKNDARRWKMTLQAEKEGWTFEEVEARVQYAIGKDEEKKRPSRLPFVCLGPFFTYKIMRAASLHSSSRELLLDLGFKHRLEMSLFGGARFAEGAIVTASENSFTLAKVEAANDDSLYTYKARVEEVMDGDTLKIDFFLGLGNRKGETIRLNHIDCPEMNTREGKAAKRFVESALEGCEFITVKSVRTRKEKWGRYLGDVFFERKSGGPLIYLNQLLLDRGHAVRVRPGHF